MSQQQFRLRFNEGFEQGEKLCSRGERIALGSAGRFGLRVAVDPPVASNVYIDSGISFLILTAFFTDTNLFPVDEWPCHVRVVGAAKWNTQSLEIGWKFLNCT